MLKTAVEWLSKAADAGHAEAKKKLDYAQSQLPESQYWKAREYFIGGKIAEAAQCLRKSGRSIRMGDFIDSKVVGVSLFLIRLFLCDVACVLGVICYWTPIFVLNQKGWFEIFCYGVVTITPVLVLVLMCGGSEALQSYFRYKRLLMMMKSGDGK
jgi:TPR repeat protein